MAVSVRSSWTPEPATRRSGCRAGLGAPGGTRQRRSAGRRPGAPGRPRRFGAGFPISVGRRTRPRQRAFAHPGARAPSFREIAGARGAPDQRRKGSSSRPRPRHHHRRRRRRRPSRPARRVHRDRRLQGSGRALIGGGGAVGTGPPGSNWSSSRSPGSDSSSESASIGEPPCSASPRPSSRRLPRSPWSGSAISGEFSPVGCGDENGFEPRGPRRPAAPDTTMITPTPTTATATTEPTTALPPSTNDM